MIFTSNQLISIIGKKYDQPTIDKIVTSLNKTFVKYEIDTPLRVSHFLAQILHESGCFKYSFEIWGPTAAQRDYEGRISLGNNELGDGFKFRGRGWIQLTGRKNYKLASTEFGIDLIANPDLAAQYPLVAMIPGWYWFRNNLNYFADLNDLQTITHKINGGYNGLEDRKAWYLKVSSVIL